MYFSFFLLLFHLTQLFKKLATPSNLPATPPEPILNTHPQTPFSLHYLMRNMQDKKKLCKVKHGHGKTNRFEKKKTPPTSSFTC